MSEEIRLEPLVIRREWTLDGVPALAAELSLPRPADRETRAARRLERYCQLYARSYLRYCERWLLPQAAEAVRLALEASAPLPVGSARLTSRVLCNERGVLSLFSESVELCAGRTERRRHGDTWDLFCGTPIPLSACFPKKYPWRKALVRRAEAELELQERAGAVRLLPGWRHRLRRCFSPDHFYLSASELFWFWQAGTLTAGMRGAVFSMPLGESDCFFPGNCVKIKTETLETP